MRLFFEHAGISASPSHSIDVVIPRKSMIVSEGAVSKILKPFLLGASVAC
jgi:hypothetical protein